MTESSRPVHDRRQPPAAADVHALEPNTIERYRPATRINHWITALSFLAAALSGLSLFHPSLFGLSSLFGGGTWTRILHPFLGVVMVLAFVLLAMRMWRDNVLTANDRIWLRNTRQVIDNDDEGLPPAGRFNAGQKVLFWVIVVCLALLLLTGVVMWRAYFSHLFPIGMLRLSTVVHAVFALVLVCGIIVHIYAAFWIKGAFGAMTEGKVSYGWAWRHHRLWFRDVVSGRRDPD
ncbi:MAG: formate dehydrogenase subunit gamma [Pseudoxanthomonas suwonensis]|nr:formate dehydrogenase subunit gamma [Pseudoxanthomonas suwonensis]